MQSEEKKYLLTSTIVSVIVPIYNVEIYLDKCILSIISQSYKDIEIVLVDDGSTDNSGKMCDEWAEKDKRIIVIHKRNGGLSEARNIGLLKSKGDYILFVDSDDWIANNTVETLVVKAEKNMSDLVVYQFLEVKSDKNCLDDMSISEDKLLNSSEMIYELLSEKNISNHIWRYFIKRDNIKDIFFPVGQNYEDISVAYKYIMNSKQILVTGEKMYYYRQNPNGITKIYNKKNILDFYNAITSRNCYLQGIYHDYYTIIQNNYMKNYLYVISMISRSDCLNDKKIIEISHNISIFLRQNIWKTTGFGVICKIKMILFAFLPSIYMKILYKKNRGCLLKRRRES